MPSLTLILHICTRIENIDNNQILYSHNKETKLKLGDVPLQKI